MACWYYHKGYLQVYCLSLDPPRTQTLPSPPGRSVILLSDNASFSPRLRSGIYMKLLIVCSSNSQPGASSLPEVKDRLFDLPPPLRAPVRTWGPIFPPWLINMTKHWPEQSLLAPPALSHLGEHHDHQLDFHRNAQQNFSQSCVARSSSAQHWPYHLARMVPQQLSRLEKPAARPEHLTSATAFMDTAVLPDSSYPNPQDAHFKQEGITRDSCNSEREKSSTSGGKKKNYQRYPKPPYSYLAMIAMVIQRSPEKKLPLSEVRMNLDCSHICMRLCAQCFTWGNFSRGGTRCVLRTVLLIMLTLFPHYFIEIQYISDEIQEYISIMKVSRIRELLLHISITHWQIIYSS